MLWLLSEKPGSNDVSDSTVRVLSERYLNRHPFLVNIFLKFNVEMDVKSSRESVVCKIINICSLFKFLAHLEIWNPAFLHHPKPGLEKERKSEKLLNLK